MKHDLHDLRVKCAEINDAGWSGISSFWATATILDLVGEVERLTTERNQFALYIATMAVNPQIIYNPPAGQND